MGTHPIFESDFDCLTEIVGLNMKWFVVVVFIHASDAERSYSRFSLKNRRRRDLTLGTDRDKFGKQLDDGLLKDSSGFGGGLPDPAKYPYVKKNWNGKLDELHNKWQDAAEGAQARGDLDTDAKYEYEKCDTWCNHVYLIKDTT